MNSLCLWKAGLGKLGERKGPAHLISLMDENVFADYCLGEA